MSYGVILKNANNVIQDNVLNFYPTQRGGISTSDPYYFSLVGFNSASSITLSFSQSGSIISADPTSSYTNINFDLNDNNFYATVLNTTKPTVVQLCEIDSYEVGVGITAYKTGISTIRVPNPFPNNTKYIRNISDPNFIYNKTSAYPIGVVTSNFSNALNYTWPTVSPDLQNFVYTKFATNNITKYFLAVPQIQGATIPNNFLWYELPSTQFYFDVNYYITNLTASFNGTSLPLSSFKNIIPTPGQKILINNFNFSDTLSGLYTVDEITNNVNLVKSDLSFNYPGQIFSALINLDSSTNLNYVPVCYFVPYEYGYPAECFTKGLKLTQFTNPGQNSPSSYVPLYKDNYSSSIMSLNLNPVGKMFKESDRFVLGIAVSNWMPDSKLFGIDLNYEIFEGL